MCINKDKNGKKTPYCNNICNCVDWSNAEEWVRHIRETLIIERDVLTYDSLDTLESYPPVLCVLGKCQKCGKQICIGGELKDVSTFDALMVRLLSDVFCCDRNDETKIEDAVIALLHETDRERALDRIYINRDKASSGRFDGINPKFIEHMRHVPGYELDVKKSLYTGLGADNADLDMIAALSTSDVDWLREQHAIRIRRETAAAQRISEYAQMWNRYALETRMFGDALDIAAAKRTGHTGNQWVESVDGRRITHEISNAVYIMKIHMDFSDPQSVIQTINVWWTLKLNVPHNIYTHHGTDTIAKGEKNRISSKESAEKYVTGRKKAYARYFTVENPPVPQKYARYFSVNGVLLPEYTIGESE